MIKHISFIALFAVVVLMSSCKKERDCTCQYTTTNDTNGNTLTSSQTETTPKLSRKDAKTWCEANDENYDLGDYSYSVSCKLD